MADTKIPVPPIPVNRKKKEASLKIVRAEIDALDLKRQISMPRLLLDQIHYISLEYWIIQSFFLIAAVVLLTCFGSLIKGSENILPPVCALSSGLGLAAVLELAKSRSCRMAELEQSCCFNLGQIWAVKLVFSAGVNLCILTLLLFGIRYSGSGRVQHFCPLSVSACPIYFFPCLLFFPVVSKKALLPENDPERNPFACLPVFPVSCSLSESIPKPLSAPMGHGTGSRNCDSGHRAAQAVLQFNHRR